MPKAIKTAIVVTLGAFVVIAVGAPAFVKTFTFLGMTGTSAFLAFTATSTFVMSALGSMLAPDPPSVALENFGTKASRKDANAPRQIIYGQTRVGGTITQMETVGDDNNKLCMFIVIAGHQITSIEKVFLNDNEVRVNKNDGQGGNTTTSTVSGETVHEVTDSAFINTENDNSFTSGRLIRFTIHDGSQTARDGLAAASLGTTAVPTTHKFTNCAYIYMECIYDPEFLSSVPQISFEVKGKNIFDPRTNAVSTTDAQRSNPALIIRDYLSNSDFGLKATTTELNDSTSAGGFASAANTCDQSVSTDDSGGTESRYTCNGFTNMTANAKEFLSTALASMAGSLTYTNGKFNVFAGANQTASMTITDEDCLSDLQITTKSANGDLFNTVKGIFTDSENKFIGTDAPVLQNATFLAQDTPSGESSASYVKTMELKFPFTNTVTMAQRLMKIALLHQRQTITISGNFTLEFMKLQPKDYVNVTNTRLGFSSKLFEVEAVNLDIMGEESDPQLVTSLQLKEMDTAVYDFATNEYSTPISVVAVQNKGTSTLLAPTGASRQQTATVEGVTTKINIDVSWTARNDPSIVATEVQFKLNSDSNYKSITTGPKQTRASIPNVVVGETYNIRLRNIGKNGEVSANVALSDLTIVAVTTAPNTPSGVSIVSGKSFQIGLSWTNPNNSDLRAVKIYRKTSNVTPTDDTDLVETIYGEPNAKSIFNFGVQDGLTAGVVYYFWLRAINHSGVHSPFTSSVNGSFTTVDGSTLAIDSSDGIKLDTFDAVSHVNVNTLSANLFSEAQKVDFSFNNSTTFTNIATNVGNGSLAPILSSPINLIIPATKTAESKNYIASCVFGPVGKTNTIDNLVGTVICVIAISTNSSATVTSDFLTTEERIHSGDSFALSTMTLQKGFSVTTSTSATVTRFIHVYGFQFGIYGSGYDFTNAADTGDLGFTVDVSVSGAHR
tara:strand:- start:1586 stop:4447 length:2862 start_codon:yes stop_codon:yes gene_type:complete